MSDQATTDELVTRLSQAKEALDALRRGEVDVILGEKYNFVVLAELVKSELENAASEWQSTFDAIPEGICILASDQKILRCNKGMVEMFSKSGEEIVGRYCWEIVHGTTRPIAGCPLRKMQKTCRKECLEFSEKGRWLKLSVYPVTCEEADSGKVVHVFQDITTRKELHIKQEKTEAQLRQAQKMESVARLAGGVAHDFNNMLSIIIGFSEMVKEKLNPNDPLCHDMQEILTAARKSADLTRQLLAFSRQQAIATQCLEINEIVESSQKMLGRLIGEDIELTFTPGNDLWKVNMDPSQVDQILANLAVNARDAISGVGSIAIETKNIFLDKDYCVSHDGFKPGEYVLLSFCDSGTGMDKETMEKVFEPFFTTKEEGKGTGLGLSTVYGIAKQNNGFVDVYSEINKGSTFNIYLPQYSGFDMQQSSSSQATMAQGGSETVLLVDDEEQLKEFCKRILEKKGYTVLSAIHPEEAILLAERHNGDIHLLVTDIIMPTMNGKKLYDKIVQLKPGIKTLFMSGYMSDRVKSEGIQIDQENFIQKPFNNNDFFMKIRHIIDNDIE